MVGIFKHRWQLLQRIAKGAYFARFIRIWPGLCKTPESVMNTETITGTDTVTIGQYEVDIEYQQHWEHDPGVWTHRNGDPGEPPSSEIVDVSYDIKAIHINDGEDAKFTELSKDHPNFNQTIIDHIYEIEA